MSCNVIIRSLIFLLPLFPTFYPLLSVHADVPPPNPLSLKSDVSLNPPFPLTTHLPCTVTTDDCISQLQSLAISHNFFLSTLNQRIYYTHSQIQQAKDNNQHSILWEHLSPFLQYYLQPPPFSDNVLNPLDRFFSDLSSPLRLVGNIFGLIGIPVLRNLFGGSPQRQQRAIAISDLEIKLEELKTSARELESKIKQQVVVELIELENIRTQYEVSSAIAVQYDARMQLMKIGYSYGDYSTETYLNHLANGQQHQANVQLNVNRLRSQLLKLEQLVGSQGTLNWEQGTAIKYSTISAFN